MIHYITTSGIGNAWVAAELEVMERKGIPFALHSLRGPHQNFFGSPWAARLDRQTRRIYPLPPASFALSVLLAPLLFGRRFFEVLGNALVGERESFRGRLASIAHAFVACHWARRLRDGDEPVALVHAHWAHSAATVGMYGAWLLGVPFSFTGHAVDLFRDRVALRDKVRRADFIVCISEFHRDFYKKLGARDERLHVVYCGIDADAFAFRRPPRGDRRPRILSVGRLVEKKGFHVLVDACRALADRGLAFDCVIAGDGPWEARLREQVARLGLEGVVTITGKPLLQEELPDFLAGGDLFAQPCVWSSDNDVDGTPRTLMEAMACGAPSVSTRLAGIPDILEHDRSGLLVEPGDVVGLADALRRLIEDPALADRLARGGREQILRKFQIDDCLEPLADLFRRRLAAGRPVAAAAAVAS
ncbi:MAG TPA: glycosyltransferase family 4 protein [Isosphaeraceae bacterium]|jgi:glycosyltransferase involved in cell wall biosynthesis|nr:glycosyltransferase family 4 protein [Isosphaeraceae bacterium]